MTCPSCHSTDAELDDAELDTLAGALLYSWTCRGCGRRWVTN